MKHFFWIILLILLQINNNSSFATNTKNSKFEISNSESLKVENALFQLDEDTVSKNFVKAAPSIMMTCVNTSVTLTNTAIPGNSCSTLANYVWNFGDGFTMVSTQLTSPQSKTHTYSTPGLYHVTLTATNGCGTLTNSIDICVEPPPVPKFNLDVTQGCAPLTVNATNTTNTTAICSTPTYSWDVTYTPGNCGTVAAYTYLGGSSASSTSPTFQFTNPGIYTIKLAVTNFCGTYYNTQTVEVKQPPVVSINNIPDFCETATINPTANVTSCSPLNALTYAWSFPGGSPSFSTNAIPTNITYSSPGTYTVLLNVTNECGVSVTDSKTFTVKSAPKVTNSPLSQTVCSGFLTSQVNLTADIPGTTFSWTATATPGVSGFIPSGTTNTLPPQTLSTTGTTAGTVTYAITPFFNGCTGPTVNYVVTVNPAPVFTLQPLPSTVCLNGIPTNLAVAISPIADTPFYQWYAGGVAIPGATNPVYTPSTSAVGITNYYCIVSFSSGACADIQSNTVSVTVAAPPSINTQPTALQAICVGGSSSALSVSYSGGAGTPSYQWYSNTSNSNVGGSAIPGATGSSYSPPTFTIPGNYYYYAVVTLSGINCGSATSNPAQVTVVADPVVSSQPTLTQTVCQGSVPTTIGVTATGGTGSFIYQWYQNSTNSNAGGNLIAGETNSTFTPPTTAAGTNYYYCEVSQSGLNCSVTSNTSEVVVNLQPSVVTQPVSSTVCIGGTPTVLSVSTVNGVGVPTYQWYSNTINNTTSGTPIGGATAINYNPSGAVVGTTYYYCVISYLAGGCNLVTSDAATVTVNSLPTINVQPTSLQDICVGGPIGAPLTVAYTGGVGNATYQWYSNTSNSNVGGTPIVGATGSTYNPPVFTVVGSYYYYAEVTLSGSNCGSAISNPAQINVVADPVVTTQPLLTQTVCQTSIPTSISVTASGGVGSFIYQWYQNTTNSNVGGTPIPGATGSTFAPSTALTGTTYYYCSISQTGLNCNVTSATSEVIVNPAPTYTSQPLPQSVCIGGTLSSLSVSTTGGVGAPTYQWYSNTVNSTSGGTLLVGETSSTYNPSSAAVGTTYYYCIVSFAMGGCNTVISNTAEIIVASPPSINVQPTSLQDICVGGTIGTPLSVGYTGGVGAPSYQWYSNTVNSTIGGVAIAGATSSTYLPPVLSSVGHYYYYAIVTLSGSNCGFATSNVADVNVVADPTVSTQPLTTQTICQGSIPTTINVAATGGLGVFSYQWYQNTTNSNAGGTPISGETNATFTPSTTVVGTTYYYCLITQTGLHCAVTSNTSEVIVNLQPTFTSQPVSSTICVGGLPLQLSVATINGVGAPTYQWYSNTVNNTTTGTPIAGATSINYNPSAATAGTTYYYCEVTFAAGCNTIISNTAEIIVAPPPSINVQPTSLQEICVGGPIGAPLSVGYTGGVGAPSYQWYSNTVNSTIGGVAIAGATSSAYLPPVLSSVGHYYYYAIVTLSGSNCGFATSSVADVNVVADPTVSTQPLTTQTICQGSIPTIINVAATGGLGVFSYQWYQNTTNSNAGGTPISGETNATFTPSTTVVGTTYYYCLITQTGLNCEVTSNTSEVIVNPQPTFTSQPVSSTICVGGLPLQLSVATINGVGAPTYQWYSNTVNNTTTGTPIAGATSINYNPSGATAGTTYYYCEVTFAAGCNVITSNTATVTVIPSPTINVQPTPVQEICAGDAIGAPLTVTYINGVGTPSYQWFSNTINSNAGGTVIAGATNAAYTPPPFTVSGNYYYYVEVTLSGNGCVPAISSVAQVIVDANPTLTPQLVPTQTVCINTIPQTLSITASGGLGAYTYQWYQNTVNSSIGGTAIAGALSSTYVPSTASLGTLYYYCIVKSSLGANCGVTSDVATVTVNPEPTFTSQPVSSVVCVGGIPAALSVTYKDGAGTPSYQWYSNTINDNTTGTPIVLATSSTYNPPSALSATTYYYCVITMTPGGCATLVSNVAQVVVNPNPVITSFNTEICNGTAFSITPQDVTDGIVPAGTTYTWSMPTISPVGSVSGASAQPIGQTGISQILTNNTTGIATVTYTVTPLSGACPGPAFNVVVTVDPTIVPTVTVQNISCFGIVDGSLTASIAGGIPPYSLSWTGPSGFTSNSSSLTNLYAGNYTLTVTDSKSCQVTSTYTIVEPADIKITTDIHKNVTFFGADNAIVGITVTGGTPPYNYAWTKDSVAFATTEDLSNIGPGYYKVTVTDSHSCAPKYAFYDVTVPPALIVSLVSKVDLNCFGDNYGAITVDAVGGTPIQISPGVFDYTYSWAGPNGFTSTSKNLTNLVAGTYVLNVTDNSGFSKQLTVVLTQPSPILVNFSSAPKLDCATKIVSEVTTAHVSGGVAPYNLLWSRGTVSGLNKEIMESNQAGPVTLQITDGNGCVVDTTFNLSIKPIGIDYKVLDCDKHSYQFNALVLDSLSTYTYNWDFGDGVTDVNKTVNHTFATTGNKTVQLTITSPACAINFSQVVAVEAPPVLTLDREPKICIGDSTIVRVSGAATYLWNDNSKSDSIMINRTGEYSVTGTSASGCTATLKFMVSNYNLYNYTIQTNKNEVSVTSPTVRFGSESYAGSQYIWDFGDGKTDHGNNLDHTFDITNEKTFNVTLKAIDPDGCTEYATKQIIVVNSSMYNTFTPNGDGIDDVFMKSWHIKVYNRNSVLIYDGVDGWDGTYKGKPVSNDTYFFVVYYASESGAKTNSGYVTVVR